MAVFSHSDNNNNKKRVISAFFLLSRKKTLKCDINWFSTNNNVQNSVMFLMIQLEEFMRWLQNLCDLRKWKKKYEKLKFMIALKMNFSSTQTDEDKHDRCVFWIDSMFNEEFKCNDEIQNINTYELIASLPLRPAFLPKHGTKMEQKTNYTHN